MTVVAQSSEVVEMQFQVSTRMHAVVNKDELAFVDSVVLGHELH